MKNKETREEKAARKAAEKAELREERKALARWDRNMKRLKAMGAVLMLALIIHSCGTPQRFHTGDILKADYALPYDYIVTDGEGLSKEFKNSKPGSDLEILEAVEKFAKPVLDTVYVNNVFINGRSVAVRSGYILQIDRSQFVVNSKIVRLLKYKPTENPKYKKQ